MSCDIMTFFKNVFVTLYNSLKVVMMMVKIVYGYMVVTGCEASSRCKFWDMNEIVNGNVVEGGKKT